jgi:hypothetical protein
MRNISGIAPYIELSKTAKSYGGPKSYIYKLRSSEYVSGYSAGYSSGNTAGLITGCIVTGLATGVILGLWSYKKYKAKVEREEYTHWNRK